MEKHKLFNSLEPFDSWAEENEKPFNRFLGQIFTPVHGSMHSHTMQALCCPEAGWAQMGKYDHDSRNSGAFLILKPNSTIHHISREVTGETEGGEQDT